MTTPINPDQTREHPFDVRFREEPNTRLGEVLTPILSAKLDDMALHDDTGDPRDEGYMAAIEELREWMAGGDAD